MANAVSSKAQNHLVCTQLAVVASCSIAVVVHRTVVLQNETRELMDMEGLHQTQLDLDAFDPPNTEVGDQSASTPNSPNFFSRRSNDEVSAVDSEPSFSPSWYKHEKLS